MKGELIMTTVEDLLQVLRTTVSIRCAELVVESAE